MFLACKRSNEQAISHAKTLSALLNFTYTWWTSRRPN